MLGGWLSEDEVKFEMLLLTPSDLPRLRGIVVVSP